MDNLQKKADRLAILFTGAFFVVLTVIFLSNPHVQAASAAEETAKFQILSIEHELPALGDPVGGVKEEAQDDFAAEEALKPLLKEETAEEARFAVTEKPKELPKVIKTPKKEKKPAVKKTKQENNKTAKSMHDTDVNGNGSNKGRALGQAKAHSQEQSSKAKANYNNAAAALLSKASSLKEYPSRAKRQGIEGKCVIGFQINKRGEVFQANITQKSGQVLLDAACKRLASKLIGFNVGSYGEELNIQVPINYRLVN